jgi:hypothetical protein
MAMLCSDLLTDQKREVLKVYILDKLIPVQIILPRRCLTLSKAFLVRSVLTPDLSRAFADEEEEVRARYN